MSVVAVLLVVATCLYAGFQWTIRVVVYPQFTAVPAAGFTAFERSHQRLVSFAVGPLFVAFGLLAALAVIETPATATAVVAGCFVLILAVTAALAVPQHRTLSAGFDAAAHRRLLRADSLRLLLAVTAAAVATVHACRV